MDLVHTNTFWLPKSVFIIIFKSCFTLVSRHTNEFGEPFQKKRRSYILEHWIQRKGS